MTGKLFQSFKSAELLVLHFDDDTIFKYRNGNLYAKAGRRLHALTLESTLTSLKKKSMLMKTFFSY